MLPPILGRGRRRGMVLLALNGISQAGLALTSAWLFGVLVTGSLDGTKLLPVLAMLAAGLGLVWLRYHEHGEAERLGQAYVLEVRLALLSASIEGSAAARQRHGIAMARLTNDLASIKNWISLGIARTLVGGLSLSGAIGALWLWSPQLAIWALVVLATILLTGALLTIPLARNIREGRRQRGRLSARVGELMLARETLDHFDAIDGEARRVRRLSRRMATALSLRMAINGAMQALADLLLPAAAMIFLVLSVSDPRIATQAPFGALVIVAFMASPVRDLMRVADYRIAYHEARRRLRPILMRQSRGAVGAGRPWYRSWRRSRRAPEVDRPAVPAVPTLPALHVRERLMDGNAAVLPRAVPSCVRTCLSAGLDIELIAGRIVNLIDDPAANRRTLRWLAGLEEGAAAFASIRIDGEAIDHTDRNARRRHFKLVSRELQLLRRSGERNLTDLVGRPDSARLQLVLELCELDDDPRFRAIRKRRLQENGQGLDRGLTARLLLARAVLAGPRAILVDDPIFLDDPVASKALEACVGRFQLSALVATSDAARTSGVRLS